MLVAFLSFLRKTEFIDSFLEREKGKNLISFVAHVDKVLVFEVLLLLPAVRRSEIGSTSNRVTIATWGSISEASRLSEMRPFYKMKSIFPSRLPPPKAEQRSPMSPALAATLASLCSESLNSII